MSERRDCIPSAVFGRGGEQGPPGTSAEEEMSRNLKSPKEMGAGWSGADMMPDFGAGSPTTFLPEGIQRTEFFKAALLVACKQGPLAAFATRSLAPIRTDAGLKPQSDLWPPSLTKLSPRRRKKRKFLRLKAFAMERLVVTLNWLALGQTMHPPERARKGYPMSSLTR